jgi:FkbM family methyltransferase
VYRSRVPAATSSSHFVRTLARKAAALLPRVALDRVAAFRFGHTAAGRRFVIERRQGLQGPEVTIDRTLRLHVTPEFMADLEFHFVDNGQSRNEIGAFLDVVRRLPPGALLFDVGAHRGLFSLVHCAVAPDRRAVLFEPSASLALDAARLLSLNGFASRAVVRRCGAGARTERRRIVEDRLGFARDAAGDSSGDDVEFTTLDDAWGGGTPPAVVKIDVEGAEAEVIRGAAGLLRAARPVLFLELHLDELERRGEPVADVLRTLSATGYRFAEPGGSSRTIGSIARSLRAIVRLVATAQ